MLTSAVVLFAMVVVALPGYVFVPGWVDSFMQFQDRREGLTPISADQSNATLDDTVAYCSRLYAQVAYSIGALIMILISYIAQLCITLYTYLRTKRSGNPPTEGNLEARIDESSLAPCLRSESPELPIGFKLSKEQLSMCKKLCQGRYGTVMEAQLSDNGTRQKVAVRVIKGSGGDKLLKASLEMVQMMAYLGQHLNLVNMLGAVTKGLRNGELLVVAEYCQHGTLLNFLRRNKRNFIEQLGSNPHNTWTDDGACSSSARPSGKIVTYIDLMSWSYQIASAMSFLESYNVVHGHLALENVLLCDKKVIKLDKVGLLPAMAAGHSYVGMGEDFYPYKWFALECFSEREFTTKSDVWSFGVLLWELFTLGETPYAGMPNKDLYRRLDEGFRLELPDNAFPEIHDMMRMCWYIRPYLRPSFKKLKEGLSAMLPKEITMQLKELNYPYEELNTRRQQDDDDDFITTEHERPKLSRKNSVCRY